jgi:phage terminase large subunit GpA-like protein
MVSTPAIAEAGRIEAAYLESDQRKYFVPCPYCRAYQTLRWAQVKWPDHKPSEAWYECERCHERVAGQARL